MHAFSAFLGESHTAVERAHPVKSRVCVCVRVYVVRTQGSQHTSSLVWVLKKHADFTQILFGLDFFSEMESCRIVCLFKSNFRLLWKTHSELGGRTHISHVSMHMNAVVKALRVVVATD